MGNQSNQLDQKFEYFCQNFSNLWNSFDFEDFTNSAKIELFERTVPVEKFEEVPEEDGFGVYCFWIEKDKLPPFEEFKEEWNINKDDLALSQPFKKWFNENKKIKDNFRPFYLGKRENIMNRIEQHINNSSKTTYGLHLYRGNEKWKKGVHVSWFKFPPRALEKLKTNTENKMLQQLLLTYLEYELRQKFNPMIGKQ